MYGEKKVMNSVLVRPLGSPPRVRGKGIDFVYCVAIGWDHPRACGEKALHRNTLSPKRGSPPRLRGKETTDEVLLHHSRITPACAGKRDRDTRTHWIKGDHPRVCGEKVRSVSGRAASLGSLPRMRGKEMGTMKKALSDGITPACAGKSSIQHLTASLGEFEVQKGHPVFHLRQRLQVWPDHARHLRHGLILHASRSAGQGRRLCPGPCPDTAGS